MTFTRALSTNNYGPAKFIVDGTTPANGTHSTIAAALTSASSGNTIFIRPGTYTENLTLKAGVNLTAFQCDVLTPNVTIVGKMTMTNAGTTSISGIRFQDNSDNILAVTGTEISIVNFFNCYFHVPNNIVALLCSSTGAGTLVNLFECRGGLVGATSSFFGFSRGGLRINYSSIANSNLSTVASTFSNDASGSFTYSGLNFSITTSNTGGVGAYYCNFRNGTANATILTLAGTGTNILDNCIIESGTASAVSVGAGVVCDFFKNTISSSNTNAVTGAGTINYSDVTFSGSSSLMNTTTQTANYTNLGKWKGSGQPAFLAYVGTTITNVTGDNTVYTIIYDVEVYDQGADFNLGTSTFTAPVTGRYYLNHSVLVVGGTVIQSGNARIVTSNRTYNLTLGAGVSLATTNGSINQSVTADMDAADTMTITITTSDTGGKVDDVSGTTSGDLRTWVSGILLA